MDKKAQVIELLRRLGAPKGDIFFYGEVTKITGDTCSVKVADLELTDVRLKATDDGSEDKLVITPAVGSKVIVGANHGDFRDLVVLKVDDPSKIYYKHKKVKFIIDGDGETINIEGPKFTFKNSQEDMKKILTDLLQEIQKLTVTTGTGPSGIPINLAQFKEIEQRIPKLFQ